MRITFIGTGTSYGIPVIGCKCEVCKSDSPFNKRLRSSVIISYNGKNILIDTTPDLRTQLLNYPVDQINAVLYTHHHADHLFGIDDIRIFNKIQKSSIPCYGSKATIDVFKRNFDYIFNQTTPKGGGLPDLELYTLNDNVAFDLFCKTIIPVPIMHGNLPIFGYRWEKIAYITDCSFIPDKSMSILEELDTLVINGLRFTPHPTHHSIFDAINISQKLNPKRTYLTHISHEIDHLKVTSDLPPNIFLAHDGLVLEI